MQIGDWFVDPSRDVIRSNGTEIKLEPRAMRLLCFMADPPGEVHTTDELLSKVWPGLVVGQNSLYQAIAQLRRALGDLDDQARYIETVPRKGYRLIAPVTSPPPAASAAAGSESAAAPVPVSAPGPTWNRRGLVIGGAALVLVAAGGWVVSRWQATGNASPAQNPAIAVMPFLDLSAGAREQAFAEGLTEELTNTLARVPGLKVTGRTSSRRAVVDEQEPRKLGKMLGVGYVLQGSVRTSEGRVRVSARVVSTADGFQVWSNNYDRSRTGAIGVQTDIAREVVGSLKIKLSPEASGRIDLGPTSKLNAYDLYLLGRNQQSQRNPEALARAIEYHTQAIAIDPRFALAYAGLADAQMAGYYYANRPLDDTAILVEKSVGAALAIDPELPEAYAARAVLRTEQADTDDAIADLQRAIAINPNAGEFYLRLGAAYEYAGRPRDALQAYDQVLSLDPLHTQLHVRRCLTLQNLGRYAEATQACSRAFELQPEIPNHLWASGLNDFAQGKTASAIAFYQQALARAPQRIDIRSELGLLYLDQREPDLAAGQFEQALAAAGPRVREVQLTAARLYLARGQFAALLEKLRSKEWLASNDARQLLNAGFLAAAAGDAGLAEKYRARAVALVQSPHESLQPGLYSLRWGNCELCYLAMLERLRGAADVAQSHEAFVLARLVDNEKAGHRWHGLEYVRATVLAQQGNDSGALQALQRAAHLGWRSVWLTEVDPAFTRLRKRPEFQRLVSQQDNTARGTQSRSAL
jgi:TolB-like protein/DNA-binding winged helix-turn-helix (wHTH) protein/tetratricopeptide (TPR) repeat protein